jgi:hypothetical protein
MSRYSASPRASRSFALRSFAMALRIHLSALLRAMVDDQLCSRQEVRDFVLALEQEAIGATDE